MHYVSQASVALALDSLSARAGERLANPEAQLEQVAVLYCEGPDSHEFPYSMQELRGMKEIYIKRREACLIVCSIGTQLACDVGGVQDVFWLA